MITKHPKNPHQLHQRKTITKHLQSIKLLQRRKLLNQQLLPRITRNLNLTKLIRKPQVPQTLPKTTRKPQLLLKITKLLQPIKLRMLRLKSKSKQMARYLLNQLNILMNNSRNCLTISRLSSKPSKQRESNRVNSKSHQRRQ